MKRSFGDSVSMTFDVGCFGCFIVFADLGWSKMGTAKFFQNRAQVLGSLGSKKQPQSTQPQQS
jgi:hypothetical protein